MCFGYEHCLNYTFLTDRPAGPYDPLPRTLQLKQQKHSVNVQKLDPQIDPCARLFSPPEFGTGNGRRDNGDSAPHCQLVISYLTSKRTPGGRRPPPNPQTKERLAAAGHKYRDVTSLQRCHIDSRTPTHSASGLDNVVLLFFTLPTIVITVFPGFHFHFFSR